MKPAIHPLLLCGGSGTRLWPLSRKSYPKQFAKITGDESLFQQAVTRLSGEGFAPPVIVTGNDFRFIVTEQLAACEIASRAVLIEPEGRNTAPAVLAAALVLAEQDPKALILVAPSDHVIPDAAAFREAVQAAASRAQAGDLITFGITPDRPETGYGYLELAEGADAAATTPQTLARFVEKPDVARAKEMLASGKFLWNAGIFLFTAESLIAAFRAHAPDVFGPVEEAVREAHSDLGFTRLAPGPWGNVPEISIDYAIMERASNLAVMPYGAGWSDLGGWDAVWQESGPDAAGNVTSNNATAIDCTDTLLRSESERVVLVGIGLDDIIAVATSDAVLVAHKSQAQRVKEAVAALKTNGASQATTFPVDHRPWGWFESLVVGNRFQVKRSRKGALRDLVAERRTAFPSSGEINFVLDDVPAAVARVRATFEPEAKGIDETDGLSLDMGAWRFNLRASNTEPVLRLNVETRGDAALLAECVARVRALVEG